MVQVPVVPRETGPTSVGPDLLFTSVFQSRRYGVEIVSTVKEWYSCVWAAPDPP